MKGLGIVDAKNTVLRAPHIRSLSLNGLPQAFQIVVVELSIVGLDLGDEFLDAQC